MIIIMNDCFSRYSVSRCERNYASCNFANRNGSSWNELSQILKNFCIFKLIWFWGKTALLPLVMEKLESYSWMQRIKFLHAPFQIFACGAMYINYRLLQFSNAIINTDYFLPVSLL